MANNQEMESERSDVLILSRHHCPEVTTIELVIACLDFSYTLTNVYIM